MENNLTPAERRTGMSDRVAALTPAARRALINCHARVGAHLPQATMPSVVVELRQQKLVNARNNLTGLGEQVRAAVLDAMLEEL